MQRIWSALQSATPILPASAAWKRIGLCDYLFYPPHLPVLQADLYAVRVRCRAGEDIFDDALGELAGWLILLEDNQHRHAGFDVGTDRAVQGLAGG